MTEEKRGFLPRPHIQTLSDLIFGLALSIGAITLIGQLPTNATEVFVAIGQYVRHKNRDGESDAEPCHKGITILFSTKIFLGIDFQFLA